MQDLLINHRGVFNMVDVQKLIADRQAIRDSIRAGVQQQAEERKAKTDSNFADSGDSTEKVKEVEEITNAEIQQQLSFIAKAVIKISEQSRGGAN